MRLFKMDELISCAKLEDPKKILLDHQPMFMGRRRRFGGKKILAKPIELTPLESFEVTIEFPTVHKIVAPPKDDYYYIEINGKRLKPNEAAPYYSGDAVSFVIPKFFEDMCTCETNTLWAFGCQCGGR
jgi:hypothetical protein